MAIGFELETGMRVRSAGDAIDYRHVVFADVAADGSEYFHVTLDTDDDGELVLELDLSHEADPAFQARVFTRVELLRTAIATATQDMTREATLAAIAPIYEGLLQQRHQPDAEGRAAGVRKQVAVTVDQRVGLRAMGFAPQVTIGVAVPRVVDFLEAVANDQRLVREPGFKAVMLAVTAAARQRQGLAAPIGLLALVEMYQQSFEAVGRARTAGVSYLKAALPVMAKTDFHSAYQSMSEPNRDDWARLVAPKKQAPWPAVAVTYPDSRTGGLDGRHWLESIVSPIMTIGAPDRTWIADRFKREWDGWMNVLSTALTDQEEKAAWGALDEDDALDAVSRAIEATNAGYWFPGNPGTMDGNAWRHLTLERHEHDVSRLFTLFGEPEDHVDTVVDEAFDPLSRDLLSRPAWVDVRSSSMGGFPVADEGDEEGMVVLELRNMAQAGDVTAGWDAWLQQTYAVISALPRG